MCVVRLKRFSKAFPRCLYFKILSLAHVFLSICVCVCKCVLFSSWFDNAKHECRFHLFSSSPERCNAIFWYYVFCVSFSIHFISHKIALSAYNLWMYNVQQSLCAYSIGFFVVLICELCEYYIIIAHWLNDNNCVSSQLSLTTFAAQQQYSRPTHS